MRCPVACGRWWLPWLLGGVWLPLALLAADDYLSPGLTPEEILSGQEDADRLQVVDLRTPVEFGVAHIPGAANIPLAELEKRLDELGTDRKILIYCINGNRTRQAEPVLYSHGFENIYHLDGAFYAWIRGGYPVEKGVVKKGSW